MLSVDDTCLIRRDPLLPGLPILLDSDAFLAVLRRRLPQLDVRKAQSRYIRYKQHTHCLMAYRLDVGGRIVDIHAKITPGNHVLKNTVGHLIGGRTLRVTRKTAVQIFAWRLFF